MIGSVRGEVLERWGDDTVLVDVHGVGYLVTVTPRTLAELEPTSTAFLYVHHNVREDDQTLYGFLTRDERTTFQTLVATHGVGPALALAVLAAYSPAALVDVVAAGDIGALRMISGVGPKTAQRLMVELKDRLSLPALDDANALDRNGAPSVVGAVRDAIASTSVRSPTTAPSSGARCSRSRSVKASAGSSSTATRASTRPAPRVCGR